VIAADPTAAHDGDTDAAVADWCYRMEHGGDGNVEEVRKDDELITVNRRLLKGKL